MTDKPYTPTTDLMRQWHVLADHSGNKSTEEHEAEFDRWLATVEAAAEQRGAAMVMDALKREASDSSWEGLAVRAISDALGADDD